MHAIFPGKCRLVRRSRPAGPSIVHRPDLERIHPLRSKSLVLLAACAAASLTIAPISHAAARADDSSPDPSVIASTLQAATPDTVDAATPEDPSTDSAIALSTAGTTVASDPSNGITLGSGSSDISIQLPNADSADDAQAVSDGTVAYDNNDGSSTVPVLESDGSVQINTVIASSSAPTSYTYGISTPTGGSMSIDPDSGVVSIYNADGSWAGGVAAAWAKDADGNAVPTHYDVSGGQLTQVVDLSSPAITYPVVADPWLGIDLIDHTKWANTWQYSPTLQITPTWWGRYGAGLAADSAAWDEVLKKTARSGHPNPDTKAMRVQFDCHFEVVRLSHPNKPTWDLDSKLPWTDFATEVNYGCNYPVGKEES